MISPSSTNPRVTAGKKMVFRVCFTDPIQAAALAAFVRDNLKLTKAAILFDQTQAYSKGLRMTSPSLHKDGRRDRRRPALQRRRPGLRGPTQHDQVQRRRDHLHPRLLHEGGNIAIQARKLASRRPSSAAMAGTHLSSRPSAARTSRAATTPTTPPRPAEHEGLRRQVQGPSTARPPMPWAAWAMTR